MCNEVFISYMCCQCRRLITTEKQPFVMGLCSVGRDRKVKFHCECPFYRPPVTWYDREHRLCTVCAFGVTV